MYGSRDTVLNKGPLQSGRKKAIMPRTKNVDVDTPEVETEVEETSGPEATATTPKAKKEPARGDLPEGYVTPIGLAKELGKRGLQANREGEVLTEVRPQMVYSYIKNAPKTDPFPMETVTDSIGKERQALKLDEGIAWWERKNERTAARKANAAEKAAKKEANAKKKAEATEAEAESGEAVEVE